MITVKFACWCRCGWMKRKGVSGCPRGWCRGLPLTRGAMRTWGFRYNWYNHCIAGDENISISIIMTSAAPNAPSFSRHELEMECLGERWKRRTDTPFGALEPFRREGGWRMEKEMADPQTRITHSEREYRCSTSPLDTPPTRPETKWYNRWWKEKAYEHSWH